MKRKKQKTIGTRLKELENIVFLQGLELDNIKKNIEYLIIKKIVEGNKKS